MITRAEASAIADEQIAWWRRRGVDSCEAATALGLVAPWAASWREIRDFMVRWTLQRPEGGRVAAAAIAPLKRAA